MPIYDYFCSCGHEFTVLKSIKDHQRTEPCPKCDNAAQQDLSRCRPQFIGASVEDAYKCPALGKVIKNKYDRQESAKRAGAVEVGNDFTTGDKMHSHFDKVREDKRKASWEKDE